LKPGEKKIEHEPDTRESNAPNTTARPHCKIGTANTEMFTLRAEDHTLGNLIRDALLQMPEVTFAAYKVSKLRSPVTTSLTLSIVPPPSR
jgi:hypothetical protein